MYFSAFPKIYYDFPQDKTSTKLQILTDITTNVRIRKSVLEDITLYDEYDIMDGETPDIVAEKIYGDPELHWIIMLANQRYDYIGDFPMSSSELESHVIATYGEDHVNDVHHYIKDGFVVEGRGTLKIPSNFISNIKVNDIIINESWCTARAESSTRSVLNYIGNGSRTVRCTMQPSPFHELTVGDKFTISGAGAAGNDEQIKLNGSWEIESVISSTQFMFTIDAPIVSNTYDTYIGYLEFGGVDQIASLVSVLLDYGRFKAGSTATVKGTRTVDGTTTYGTIGSFAIPSNAFTLAPGYSAITNHQHEIVLNESKRRIRLIAPELIDQFIKEFKSLL